ncbi:MAG TPA: MFS transporter [bacterium]|nr:MFS transporter [bacterium]
MSLADMIVYFGGTGFGIIFVAIIWNYLKGLKQSPRDMWILFAYLVVTYIAYSSQNYSLTLWLSADCGLGDVAAGTYITVWSILLSMVGMVAGALVDTIGIKRTLFFSVTFLIIARVSLTFITDPTLVFIVGFIPFAIGFAIVSPVISVAIKRFTTKESAALGFGLFYVIMNAAYAVGGIFFDKVRAAYILKDEAGKIINDNAGTLVFGYHLSTYQMLYLFVLIMTVASVALLFFIRPGVELDEKGDVVVKPLIDHGSGLAAIKSAAVKTAQMLKSVVSEKYFWIFISIIGLTIFVRMVFFQFHYTFPKYGLRVLGLDAKIGAIYGVLNPVLIIFLVPLAALITKKMESYKLLVVGSIVSACSCFIVLIPGKSLEWVTDTVLGELIFVRLLGNFPTVEALRANPPTPDYWPLILFILVFTIGEAIWSPKLMQFTAEIAPKGKEGTYLALAILPFFLAKLIAGPMSGLLLNAYVPVGPNKEIAASYPDHPMVWVWIGGMAIITPIGLLLMKGLFQKREDHAAAAGH